MLPSASSLWHVGLALGYCQGPRCIEPDDKMTLLPAFQAQLAALSTAACCVQAVCCRWRLGGCAALLLTVALAGPARAEQPGEQLQQVRERMAKIQKQIRADTNKRDKVSAGLRDAEIEQASIARQLSGLARQRMASQQKMTALGRERDQAWQHLQSQNDALVEQVKMAYVNGRQEQLKLVLNQADPATIGRMMVYYRYLTDSRAMQVQLVREQLEAIKALELAQRQETERLASLEAEQSEQLEAMAATRAEREKLVATLDAALKEQDQQVISLRAREADLLALIEQLQKVFTDQPLPQEQFARLKGTLSWPLKGIVLARFGENRAGSRLRWNGVLVGAARGQDVRAIAHGRVAFADWLPGMGLLIVLEHGDDYLSLYAHAETLDKELGDWVEPGDVLATVGDSGGRSEPALYFEIRRGAKPQNPQPWFTGRLPKP